MKSAAFPETATGDTKRSLVPMSADIFEGIESTLEGMVEKKETSYIVEEGFEEHSRDVDSLLESLERKDDKDQIQ